jgi:hypothetical protein
MMTIVDKTLAQQKAHELAIELFQAVRNEEYSHPRLSVHEFGKRTLLGWLEQGEDIHKLESEKAWLFPEIYTWNDPQVDRPALTHAQATKFIEFYNSI